MPKRGRAVEVGAEADMIDAGLSIVVQASLPPDFLDIASMAATMSPFFFSLATRNSSLRKAAW